MILCVTLLVVVVSHELLYCCTNTGRGPKPGKPRQKGFFRYLNATAENLQATMIDNPQCLFLARSLSSWQRPPTDLTWDECEAAYNTWRQDFDWVGTTEQLSNVTLPFLAHLADQARQNTAALQKNKQQKQPPVQLIHSNKSPVHLPKTALNETMLQQVRERTKWDRELYDRVVRDFRAEDLVVPSLDQTANSRW